MSHATKRLARCVGLAAALSACATTGEGGGSRIETAGPVADPPLRPGAPLLLLAMPPAADFQAVRRALVMEVKKDFNISTFTVTAATRPAGAARSGTSRTFRVTGSLRPVRSTDADRNRPFCSFQSGWYSVATAASPSCRTESSSGTMSASVDGASVAMSGQSTSSRLPAGSRR